MGFKDEVSKVIKENEGLVLNLYKCPAGKTTIGYGHNIQDRGISRECAEFIFQEDLNGAIDSCRVIFGDDFFNSLSDCRKIALVDMMFNLGVNKFLTFKKFIKAVKKRDFEEAVREIIDSKAYKQCTNRYSKIVINLGF